jgi:hypothetical protein
VARACLTTARIKYTVNIDADGILNALNVSVKCAPPGIYRRLNYVIV